MKVCFQLYWKCDNSSQLSTLLVVLVPVSVHDNGSIIETLGLVTVGKPLLGARAAGGWLLLSLGPVVMFYNQ